MDQALDVEPAHQPPEPDIHLHGWVGLAIPLRPLACLCISIRNDHHKAGNQQALCSLFHHVSMIPQFAP